MHADCRTENDHVFAERLAMILRGGDNERQLHCNNSARILFLALTKAIDKSWAGNVSVNGARRGLPPIQASHCQAPLKAICEEHASVSTPSSRESARVNDHAYLHDFSEQRLLELISRLKFTDIGMPQIPRLSVPSLALHYTRPG